MRAFEFIKEQVLDEMPLPSDWDANVFKYDEKFLKKYPDAVGLDQDFKSMANYASKKGAATLGSGASRKVKIINYKGRPTALKIANKAAGVYQNISDVKVLQNPKIKALGITIPLIDYDKDHKYPVWVQTEIAEKMPNSYARKNYGTTIDDIVWRILAGGSNIKLLVDAVKEPKKSNLLKLISKIQTLIKLGISDLHSGNWGLYKGEPVVIDAGVSSHNPKTKGLRPAPIIIPETEVLDEMPLPADWDPKALSTNFQDPKTSFKSRLSYALERAKKIGTGSSRVAMTIEYQGRPTVLKIAKNKKGMAQNNFELGILTDGYYGQMDLVIPLIDYDNYNREPVWLQVELAEKATEQQLCELLRCQTLQQLVDCANSKIGKGYFGIMPRAVVPETCKELMRNGFTSEDIDIFMEYVDNLASLGSADVILGDFTRPQNWGLFKGKPVLIDLGYSSSVRKQYYVPKGR